MANIASQKKRILRTERERRENRRFTSAIKTEFRRLEEATDAESAEAAHRQVTSLIDKAVKIGAIHRNNGDRKKARASRLHAAKSA
ncbi:MAG: 30S ribosomal protein S20 [Solirubrobacteraceae bacterium]